MEVMIIDQTRIDALALDLDGVVSRTAQVHAAAWKRVLDELLARGAGGATWVPFDADGEYRAYIGGKPRRDGIRSFLAARSAAVCSLAEVELVGTSEEAR